MKRSELATKSTICFKLKEGDTIISSNTEVANIVNKHCTDAVCNLAEAGDCSPLVLDLSRRPLGKYYSSFQTPP